MRFFSMIIFLFSTLSLFANTASSGMRANGKIYVVVGVLLIIVIGFFIHLYRLDRRVKEMEDTTN